MTSENKTPKSNNKQLLTIGISMFFLVPIGLSYFTMKKNKEEKIKQQESTITVADPKTIDDTEKALQLLSTQVNKGLDSIKKNNDEK